MMDGSFSGTQGAFVKNSKLKNQSFSLIQQFLYFIKGAPKLCPVRLGVPSQFTFQSLAETLLWRGPHRPHQGFVASSKQRSKSDRGLFLYC
ncbi:hypothetical protein Q3G72_031943 [Acer saccharum]|nr:hypothetical protein Q3G72_031943 [Acer saccharum]